MKPTLLILAAGIGSRYGGLKQIDPMGPQGETLMEYGIYDAIKSGFNKAVFLFRDDIVAAFESKYQRLKDFIEVDYVFQDLNPEVSNNGVPVTYSPRVKPWGTAHAVLSAASAIKEPFAVINADDFYGRSAYQVMATFLKNCQAHDNTYAVVGYPIVKTLSDHGHVSRATLDVNPNNLLTHVVERTKIQMSNGSVMYLQNDENFEIPSSTLVSTNFWGFTPSIFSELQKQFTDFVASNHENPKSEFYIPFAVNHLIETQIATVEVLNCEDDWMGVTYQQDKAKVMGMISQLTADGQYPASLWG
ncbi:MAG: sugar phosphate nucleotidyltransferase [Cyclobacteriaceae bacterium]|nr:sugar phosphate nucleotidyltransferase [Cyclobacteriaceae bacterium]